MSLLFNLLAAIFHPLSKICIKNSKNYTYFYLIYNFSKNLYINIASIMKEIINKLIHNEMFLALDNTLYTSSPSSNS